MISPELLRRYTFFAGFSNDELRDLAMAAREQSLPAGATLFTEGTPADILYFLIDGEMETLLDTEGVDMPLSTLPAGEPLGWSALIEPHLYTASARATRECRVIGFARSDLARRLDDPHFSSVIMRRLAEVISRRLQDAQVQLLSVTATASHA